MDDQGPILSPNGKRIVYRSYGIQDSNPEDDYEVYRLNVADGLGKKNLTDTGSGVRDISSHWGVQST